MDASMSDRIGTRHFDCHALHHLPSLTDVYTNPGPRFAGRLSTVGVGCGDTLMIFAGEI